MMLIPKSYCVSTRCAIIAMAKGRFPKLRQNNKSQTHTNGTSAPRIPKSDSIIENYTFALILILIPKIFSCIPSSIS